MVTNIVTTTTTMKACAGPIWSFSQLSILKAMLSIMLVRVCLKNWFQVEDYDKKQPFCQHKLKNLWIL